MTQRNEHSKDDLSRQMESVVADDQLITSLSQGVDPSDGADELAALLLELRDEVEAPMPPTPRLEGMDDPQTAIIPIETRRRQRPWLYGLVGAAAATVVLAGAGAIFLPDVMENDRVVVELAGKLDEIDSLASQGDVEGARVLVDEAKSLVTDLQEKSPLSTSQADQDSDASATPAPAPSTVTVTRQVAEPHSAGAEDAAEQVVTATEVATVTVTETPAPSATVTNYVTVTVQPQVRENPLPDPAEQAEPAEQAPAEGQAIAPLAPPQTQY